VQSAEEVKGLHCTGFPAPPNPFPQGSKWSLKIDISCELSQC
jgi:hypothetical protein